MNYTNPPTAQPRLLADYVYLDASVYRSLQFDWSGRMLSGIADLARRSLIRVVYTDLTRREVVAQMNEFCTEGSRVAQKWRTLYGQLGLSAAAETLADVEGCVTKMTAGFDVWLKTCRAYKCREIPNLTAVLDDYFGGRPPFGPGAKKSEFPDALVVSSLRIWASAIRMKVYLVSTDKDLEACCTPESPFVLARSPREILSHGTGSVRVHEAALAFLKEGDWLAKEIGEQVNGLRLSFEDGHTRSSRVRIEPLQIKLQSMDVEDAEIQKLEGDHVSVTAYLHCELELRVEVDTDYADPDHGLSRHRQWLTIYEQLSATMHAQIFEDGDAVTITEILSVELDNGRVEVAWSQIERDVEA